ncbi:MAG: amino acid adenylation domain-containing protein [Bacteroidales bacterium]|nr:amino acid adenylation domain-containing protein [Bacteroidales bacterium]
MKILLTMNLPYTRIFGGANKSNKSLAEEIALLGHEVLAVTPAIAIPSNITIEELKVNLELQGIDVISKVDRYIFKYNGVQIHAVFEMEELRTVLQDEIRLQKPDWIFVSAEDPSQLLLKSAIDISPDNIIYLAHTPQMLPFGKESMYPGEKRTELIGKSRLVVTISEFVKDYIKENVDFNVFVNHPPHFDTHNVPNLASFDNEYVFAMNPCGVKGISILIALAKEFRNVKFAVTYGWGTTPSDKKEIERISNIEVLENQDSLDDLFKNVKLFLMPTLWSEGFGMATVDAMLRGIPVIASDFGGLKEAKLGTDYLIPVNPIKGFKDEFDENSLLQAIIPEQEIDPWILALKKLLTDRKEYEKQSTIARKVSLDFTTSLSVKPLINHLIDITRKETPKPKEKIDINNLSAEQKKKLLEKLRNKKQQEVQKFNNIQPVVKKPYYDVSYSQLQLLLIDEISTGFYGFIITNNLVFEGKINVSALKNTFIEMVKRHESFRTRFIKIDGEYKQQILDEVEFEITEIDLTKDKNKETKCQFHIDNVFNKRFDLSKTPLLRVSLVKLENEKYLLLSAMHHIISDGLSMDVFVNEFLYIYNAIDKNTQISLPSLKIQYKDYTNWQIELFEDKKSSIHKDYWHKKLNGDIPVLNLPIDYLRPAIKTYNGKSIDFQLSKQHTKQLVLLGQKHGASLFITLMSIAKILLYRYTSQNDIIVGTPVSGRKSEALRNQIGFYVNMIALRSRFNGSDEYETFLKNIKNTNVDAYEHEEYPFDKLVEELVLDRDLSRSPIFDVMVSMFSGDEKEVQPSSLINNKLKSIRVNEEKIGSSHDMAFIFNKINDIVKIKLVYNKDLFKEEKIQRLSGHFLQIVDQVINNNRIQLNEIEILTFQEKNELLNQFNQPKSEFPNSLLIHEQFENIVQRFPQKNACKFGRKTLTYFELNKKANQLANGLKSRGVEPSDIIAIISERSLETIISILAVLKSGACYLPIDPEYPTERITYTLENSECKLLLILPELKEKIAIPEQIETLWLTDDIVINSDINNLPKVNNSNDLAYVIYTSGSTGRPKGVMVQHYNLIRLLFNDQNIFDFSENDKWTLFHSFCFDFSVWEMYGALLYGGEVLVVSKEIAQDSFSMIQLLEKEKVTILNQVPGAFYSLLEPGIFNQIGQLSLRYVIFGGDTLQPYKLKAWKEKYPKIKLINMYGITETTVHVTYKEIKNDDINCKLSNIGRPIPTTRTYILDSNRNMVPKGISGELYIAGQGLAKGYLNQDDLTNKKFIANPFEKGEKLYCSGDLARYFSNGDIEYLGRIDNQVQIRGFRIELGEIENAIKEFPDVEDFIVLVHTTDSGDKFILAYIVKETNSLFEEKELRKYLNNVLPNYMVPTQIIEIEKIPLTANGKIDTKSLPLAGDKYSKREKNIQFSNKIEEKLMEIWNNVLHANDFGIEDDFFEIGGHSLSAIKVTAQIHKEFNAQVRLGDFFENSSIKDLAKHIQLILNLELKNNSFSNIPKAIEKEYYELSSAQKRIYIIQQMDLESTAYNMPAIFEIPYRLEKNEVEDIFKKLILRHESFRTGFKMFNDKPVQQIQKNVPFAIEEYQVKQEDILSIKNSFVRPFDLNQAPLIRVGIIEIENGSSLLIVDMHHIISDGASHLILKNEFSALAEKEELQPLKLQYKDFSEWQNSKEQQINIKNQQDFWINKFKGEIPVLQLPVDYVRPVMQSFEGATVNFALSISETNKIKQIAEEKNITVYMAILAIYNILLSKLSGQEEIIIGTPVATRRHADMEQIVGMFVNTLALYNFPEDSKTINNFLDEIKQSTLSAFDNQEYQFEELVDIISINRDTSRNPIFDVMFSFDNKKEDINESAEIVYESYEHVPEIAKFDLTLSAVEHGNQILMNFNYCREIFKEKTIEKFISYFKQIISQLSNNLDEKISSIEIITPKEKKQILNDFNNTKVLYPKDKTIHQLFEEQVEKTPKNIAIVNREETFTYQDINERSNQLAHYLRRNGVASGDRVALILDRSVEMIIGILGVIKSGGTYIPIDPSYPEKRIKSIIDPADPKLTISQSIFADKLKHISPLVLLNTLDLDSEEKSNLGINVAPSDLLYIIFTSGSTGIPKGVQVNHNSLVNLLYFLQEKYPLHENDSYLLKTSYCFDVSKSELFGWILGGCKLVILEKGQEKDANEIIETIHKFQITHINFVPAAFNSFSQIITPEEKNKLDSLKYIMIAGEALLQEHLQTFNKLKLEVQIDNLYGPSEATVYTSHYKIIADNTSFIPIGKPISNYSIYILSRTSQLQPIGVSGELCISGEGLSRGYLNNDNLTSEKFIEHPFKSGERLYRTGDLARWLPDGNIEFIGRIDEQVKIRGFRIELGDIENHLLKFNYINNVVVTVKKGAGSENILCVYYVAKENKANLISEIKDYLAENLPEYMIPSHFVELKELPLNSSGKIDRKKLPDPDVVGNKEYLAPSNKVEEQLVNIWADILGLPKNKISVNANFFNVGGHSLNATALVSRIHKLMNIKLSLKEIFKRQTIIEQSKLIIQSNYDKYLSIPKALVKEFYDLSSSQKRMYLLQQLDPESVAYNLYNQIILDSGIEKKKLKESFEELIVRHDSFRTSFENNNGNPVQIVNDKVDFEIYERYVSENEVDKIKKEFVRPFDLSIAPLIRVELLNVREGDLILLIDMHHIISDGTSHQIIENDFNKLYKKETLAPLNLQYKDFSEWQNSKEQQDHIKDQETYWIEKFSNQFPVLNLPTDFKRPALQSFEGASVSFTLSKKEIKILRELEKKYELTLSMIMLSIYNIFLSKLCGQDDIIVGMPIAARRHTELEDIVGMFVNTLAMRVEMDPKDTLLKFLKQIKEEALKAYENQEYQFEDLVEKVALKRDASRNPIFDVVFNLLEQKTREVTIQKIKSDKYTHTKGISKFDLTLQVADYGEEIYIQFEYCTKLFKADTIERFADYFRNVISQLEGDISDLNLSDIEIIGKKEKQQLLSVAGIEKTNYPENKTIIELFEEQVDKTPKNIAVTFEGVSITYKELDDISNKVANALLSKGAKREDVVGVLYERGINVIASILGIQKAGCAYLPLDVEYPKERISYILENSGARFLLLDKNYHTKIDESVKTIFVDSGEISTFSSSKPKAKISHNNLLYIIYTSGTTGKPKGVMVEHKNVVNLLFNEASKFDFNESDVWTMFHSHCFDFSVWEMYGALLIGGRLVMIPRELAMNTQDFLELLKQEKVTVLNQTPSAFYSLINKEQEQEVSNLNLRYVIFGGEALLPGKLKHWNTRYPKVKLINMFGITETTVHVTYKEITSEEINSGESNIGTVIPGLYTYILDDAMKPQPTGVIGELYVGGLGVARGYINNHELSSKHFVDNPYVQGEILYKTGDLARWLTNGDMEYLGRKDSQIQLRGFRIELGEIENSLLTIKNIKEAVVIDRKTETGDLYICAYVVMDLSDKEIAVDIIKLELSKSLPDYMIPSNIIQIDKVPLTSNGKINRNELPLPGLNLNKSTILPSNELEELILVIWSEILNIPKEKISTIDNFFALGGHSLKANVLKENIHKETRIEFALKDVFIHTTIKDQASHLASVKDKKDFVSIPPAPLKEYYPLSTAQKRLYFLQQMDIESTAYNMPYIISLGNNVDKKKIKEIITKLINRHESLRTSFGVRGEEPVQFINDQVEFILEEFSIKKEEVQDQRQQFIQAFDLSQAPLLRAAIVKIEGEGNLLMIDIHHIVNDGASHLILEQDFQGQYSGKELDQLNFHYKDYAVWQDQLLKNKKYDTEARSFWNKYIGEGFPKMKMPYDYNLKSYDDNCNDYQMYINENVLLGLQNLAQKQSTTLFTVVYSVFNVLLSYFVGKEEVYCSVINSGRTINQIQGIVGCFANSLLVKNNLNSEKSIQELINDNHKGFIELYSFQDFLYEEVLQEKGLKYPETSVAFNMLNFKESNETFSGKDKSFHKTNVGGGKFDLELYVNEYENGLTINWRYKNSLFKSETIEYIASCYNVLLENLVNNVEDIGNLKIDDIKRTIVPLKTSRINPSNSYIKFENKEIEQNIISRFDSKVAKYGKNPAIQYHDESLSYNELHQESCQIANAILKEKSINSEGIALLFEQGNDMIKAMLGVLRSGNYYIPLDASYPVNWLTYILKDSGARVLITNTENKQKASELKNEIGEKIEIINISNEIEQYSMDCSNINISPDSLAYILYTSGSTGFPKGVMQSHRNLLHYVMSYTNNTHISCDDKLTLFSSYGFAGSIQDIYGAILNGASLNIYNIKQEGTKSRIHEWIIQKGITIYHSTPTVYRYLLSNLELGTYLNKVRLVVLGGEVVYKKDFFEYKKYFNEDCIFINCYGSTESPITAENIVNQSIEIGGESLSIGFGVPNTEVYVGKPDGRIALPFEEGEIIIKSKHLALGYLNNPERTEQSFFKEDDGRQMFKTGDIGRHHADYSIENIGRKDFQVKIRGYRVELGEVEGLLDRHPGIYKSVVHYMKQSESEGYLIAYYVLKDGANEKKQELKRYIELHVPSFMIPNDFIQLSKFPYTLTGKIDRKSLPIPIVGFKDNYNEARTVTELKLAAIWAEVLNVAQKEISVTSNFWDIGGNSFRALILIGKIYKDIGVEFPLQDVFLQATIRAQAIHISTLEKKDFIPIPKSKDQAYYSISSAQKRIYFLQKFDLDSTAYNMPYIIPLDKESDKLKIQEVFQKLILRHQSFRTSFELNGEEIVQIIHDHVDFKVENFKIEETEKQTTLNKFTQVFDLTQAPLLRVAIVEIKGKDSLLMVDMHHIISDGVSRVILKQEFQKLYLGEDLPPLELQYKDFSEWQDSEEQKVKVKKQEQYWINRFKGEIPALELPTDYTRPDKKSFDGAIVSFTLSKEETKIIKLLTKENELTLYMSVLSVFTILLSKLTGQEDVIVGTPIAGRSHVDLENIVGLFINTLVMRNEVKGSDTLKEYLRKLKQNTLEAFEHQDYQFEDLVEQVSVERNISHNPIFNVVFNVLNQDEYSGDLSNFNNQCLIHNAGTSKFDLTLSTVDYGDQLMLSFVYSTKLFKPETIEQFILYFKQIVNSNAVKINDINLMSRMTEVSSPFDQQDVDFEF